MCRYPSSNTNQTPIPTTIPAAGAHLPAFTAQRLTPSTFLIKEWDDIWVEHPFIYAKIVHSARTILLLDTGCGGGTYNPNIGLKDLRAFIETVPVNDNAGSCLPLRSTHMSRNSEGISVKVREEERGNEVSTRTTTKGWS